MKRASWLCLWLAAAPLWAMHITRSVGVLGFSDDGASALLVVEEDGPEGGGRLGYRVVSCVDKGEPSFVVSSDFSPGGAEHPQSVSQAACQSTADTLKALLARLRFTGITVDRASCGPDHRHNVVTRTRAPQGQRFKREGAQLTLGTLRLSVVDGMLTLTGAPGTARLVTLSAQEFGRADAVMSPSNKLLLVWTRSPYNEAELLGAFSSVSGKAADFRPVNP